MGIYLAGVLLWRSCIRILTPHYRKTIYHLLEINTVNNHFFLFFFRFSSEDASDKAVLNFSTYSNRLFLLIQFICILAMIISGCQSASQGICIWDATELWCAIWQHMDIWQDSSWNQSVLQPSYSSRSLYWCFDQVRWEILHETCFPNRSLYYWWLFPSSILFNMLNLISISSCFNFCI
jgi:hypothetical protein